MHHTSMWLQALATRAHSQTMLNVLQPVLPGLIGGSADLAPSNLTIMKVGILANHAPVRRQHRYRFAYCACSGSSCSGTPTSMQLTVLASGAGHRRLPEPKQRHWRLC
jgi:hypothetical protein